MPYRILQLLYPLVSTLTYILVRERFALVFVVIFRAFQLLSADYVGVISTRLPFRLGEHALSQGWYARTCEPVSALGRSLAGVIRADDLDASVARAGVIRLARAVVGRGVAGFALDSLGDALVVFVAVEHGPADLVVRATLLVVTVDLETGTLTRRLGVAHQPLRALPVRPATNAALRRAVLARALPGRADTIKALVAEHVPPLA